MQSAAGLGEPGGWDLNDSLGQFGKSWFWIANTTLQDSFQLVDNLYFNFESFYRSERKYAFGS